MEQEAGRKTEPVTGIFCKPTTDRGRTKLTLAGRFPWPVLAIWILKDIIF